MDVKSKDDQSSPSNVEQSEEPNCLNEEENSRNQNVTGT